MKWFGTDWGAPVCKEAAHVSVPTDTRCYLCEKPIETFHTGVIMPFCGNPGDPPELAAHLRCFWDSLDIGKHAGTA